MQFCNECNNMYYLKIKPEAELGEQDEEGEGQLIYYCRNCGNEDDNLTSENICVSKTMITRDKNKFAAVVNKYTKEDPTLPRTNTIRCPNQDCISNNDGDEGKNGEVLYIRYDDKNMKYIYMCTYCDMMWKTNEQK